MYNVLFTFLHVMLAYLGITIWAVGAAFLFVAYRAGASEGILKLARYTLTAGGLLLVVMSIFAGVTYAFYVQSAEPTLHESFRYMALLFDYKLSLSSIATLLGFLAVIAVWRSSSPNDIKVSIVMSTLVVVLFVVAAVIVAWIMTTVSI
ncbi:hypothetical protein B6U99_02280 [Candidatus Geothermarchaeota archaeon ex4572_27]|nr:MAG: hypothetical protein B6U99_02280 [Candidatus Geothermarchaeota archaeon ex4572_27]